ncbi:MAG: D-alanyl-D-alanine carboxypeptidase [Clostridiales bacterium]|nr:D-alanyl-D-alanine carboxypeptidase [Clostridiales bacterium]
MKKITVFVLVLSLLLLNLVYAGAINMSVDDVESEEPLLCSESEDCETEVTINAASEVQAQIEISAKSAVLMEKSTGRVLYALNENERLYPASVTKIMTILLVCEAIDEGKISLTDTVSCSENAASKGGSQIWLEPGETMTVEELLKATCIYSANDACTLLGEYVGGSDTAFVALMNNRAKELGMENTSFDNCTGLDDSTDTHLTTAYDIALMSRELLKHEYIKDYTTIWMDSLRDGETELVNTNKLVRYYDGITGLKTGTTEKAGCCVSATAQREGMELIAVVMGSENSNDRFNSARNLLDWGFANYEITVPEIDEDSIRSVKVLHGKEQNVNIVTPEADPVLTNKGDGANLTLSVELPESVEAPVSENQVLGKIIVYSGETAVAEYELKAEKEIEQITFFSALYKILTSFTK